MGASTSAPASTPPLPDRQHWFLVCPTLNPIEQRKTRRGRPQGTEQYGMVKQYGETVSLKQGCSVVRPATLDLGSGVSPAIVLALGCRQRRSLSAPGCRTDSHDTPPSHSTQNSDRRPRAPPQAAADQKCGDSACHSANARRGWQNASQLINNTRTQNPLSVLLATRITGSFTPHRNRHES